MITGAALLALGVVFVALCWRIPPGSGGDGGARLFPLLGALSLLAAGLAQMLEGWRGGGGKAEAVQNPMRVVLLIILAAVYVSFIGKVGYLLATAAAAPLAFLLFGVRRPLAIVLSALLSPAVLHLIFFDMLAVYPPQGAWFDIADMLRGD